VSVSGKIVAFREAVAARIANEPFDQARFRWVVDPSLARFDLDDRAGAFVWACVVAALDPLMYPHLITCGGVDGRRGMTPAVYAALTGVDEAEAVSIAYWLASEPPIVRFGLLAKDDPTFLPIATPYRASRRLISHVLGERPSAPAIERITGRYDDAQRDALSQIRRAIEAKRIVIVEGPRGVGRRTAIAAATAAVALDASSLTIGEFERAARELCADAMLREAIPVIADLDRLRAEPGEVERLLGRVVDDLRGPCAITTATPGLELVTRRAMDRVAFPIAGVTTRLELWSEALVDRVVDQHALHDVALRHKLGAGQIADAAHVAATTSDGPLGSPELLAGIRSTLADRFGSLVERLTVTDQWSDMVLSTETHDQLEALIARVQHAWTVFEEWRFPRQTARGGGVAALFSGPPGTGKTMVAGLIARELGRDLYRIDLSQIVSKWVGETEKQLGQVFDAAESGNALLLFDEADSLFAKRTEVKSSSDRYANLEVNYLLQRIETFGGMTILTTNLDTSIDPALRRRLAAHVVFWPPEHEERVALWQRFLATRAPMEDDLDHVHLATAYPDMTGANIRNAALAAAFLAAREGGKITAERVHRAARAEYRAMGRVLAGGR